MDLFFARPPETAHPLDTISPSFEILGDQIYARRPGGCEAVPAKGGCIETAGYANDNIPKIIDIILFSVRLLHHS